MIDDGHAVHYAAVERGTPVFSSDEIEVGRVEQVLDNYREHIFDGLVIRAVTLAITAAEVSKLPAPASGPGSFLPNVRAGPLARLLGGGWKRG